jgi:putative phage tail component, N-terminal domain protein
MRNRTSEWFETKVRYDRTTEDGRNKKVTEAYTVEALSFTEAESVITKEISNYINGEFDVKAITRAAYSEIFFSDVDTDDRYYRVKLAFITIDEKTEKEKRTIVVYLVQAASLDKARAYIKEEMNKTMNDYEVVSISETLLLDVFEHKKQ